MNTEENIHGNSEALQGNKNASKPESEKALIPVHFRVSQEEKNRYVKQAQNEGLKLTPWLRKHLGELSENAFD